MRVKQREQKINKELDSEVYNDRNEFLLSPRVYAYVQNTYHEFRLCLETCYRRILLSDICAAVEPL